MPDSHKINILENTYGLKMKLTRYLSEVKYMKMYIMIVAIFIILCYSVFIFLKVDTVSKLGEEDQFFEWLTAIFFILAAVIFFLIFVRTKNLIFLIVAIGMLIGAGEEISWGQRLFGFKTPDSISMINVQKEFNFHNLALVNSKDFDGNWKHGLKRLLEINLLFKLSAMLCGIVLPFCIYHFKFLSRIAIKLKVPIPPISVGIFFFLSWGVYWLLRNFILPENSPVQYIDAAQEIFECTESFILVILGLYFYNNFNISTLGRDIKEII